jgi:hypothetical protein
MNRLKRHYMSCYWKIRKDSLDYVEDSMARGFLIGSTISTWSQKNISYASKISSPIFLANDTKTSKVSEKAKPHDFYPKNVNHAFIPKPDFEGYRNNVKKNFEANQDYLDEELQHKPGHPSNFMNMIKEITRAMSAANDQRRQGLPSRVICDGVIDRFEVLRNNVEGLYGQIGAGYLIDISFQEAYLEKGVDC